MGQLEKKEKKEIVSIEGAYHSEWFPQVTP
jgi:hypothetical protein